MKILRNKTKLTKMSKSDDSFVAASPQICIAFMWELTAELWSLKGSPYVKRRLQRDVANLIEQ